MNNQVTVTLTRSELGTLIRNCAIGIVADQGKARRAAKAKRHIPGRTAGYAMAAAESQELFDRLKKLAEEHFPVAAKAAV